MRDVALTLFIMASMPFVLTRPFYGLVLFTWLAYMRAPDLCWGFAKDIRFSFYVAIAMFIGYFISEWRKLFKGEIRNYLLILLTFLVFCSTMVNYGDLDEERAQGKMLEFCKIILIAVFTVTLVDTRWKLRVMIWTIALSLGFYGFKGGLFGFMGGEIMRGPGGLLEDNNDFSLAMVMNLPFLYYLSMEEKNKQVKLFLRITTILTVATVVATHSRGGFLALAVVYMIVTLRSKYKMIGISVALFAALLFVIFIPQEYVDRLKSITDTKETSSASRIIAWKTALNMIEDNPVWGVGLGNFLNNYFRYCPIEEQLATTGALVPHVAHNSYLQIWAENGTLAFSVYMLILLLTLWLLRRLKKQNRRYDGPTWVECYANVFQVTLIGYLVGATFLNRGQFDLMYQIIGLTVALGFLARAEFRKDRISEDGPPVLTIRSKDDGYISPRGIA